MPEIILVDYSEPVDNIYDSLVHSALAATDTLNICTACQN